MHTFSSEGSPDFRLTPDLSPSSAEAALLKESSAKWLNKHGLAANHLTVEQVLPTIGFRLSQVEIGCFCAIVAFVMLVKY